MGRGLVGLASLAKNFVSRSSATTTSSSSGVADLSRSKSDGNSRPALTKPDTKSSPSTVWGSGGGAFSATRPATLGKTEPSSQKSGKTVPAVPGATKSTVAPASGSGVMVSGSTVKMSQSTLMSADKRLQNMKKKAKMAEKRTR